MKFIICRFKLVLGLLLVMAPGLMFANTVTVDCTGATPGAFISITAALASLPPAGPNTITVVSNCTEHVLITSFSQLSIAATPGTVTVTADNPSGHVLQITDSTGVSIDGLNFTGGHGVLVNNGRDVLISDGTIQNSSTHGMVTLTSNVDLFNLTIQNNTGSGISSEGGRVTLDGGDIIASNAENGIAMLGGRVNLFGGDGTPANPNNAVRNNGGMGVSLAEGSSGEVLDGNDIQNNGAAGLQAIQTSTVTMSGGTITGNQGVGVHIAKTSHGEFNATTVTGNGASVGLGTIPNAGSGLAGGMEAVANSDIFITGNVKISNNFSTGVFADESSVLSSFGGNTIHHNTGDGYRITTLSVAHFFGIDTVTGNTGERLECDQTSVITGSGAASFASEKCMTSKLK
jgi:parallel beta helix pectate lyase-like protein